MFHHSVNSVGMQAVYVYQTLVVKNYTMGGARTARPLAATVAADLTELNTEYQAEVLSNDGELSHSDWFRDQTNAIGFREVRCSTRSRHCIIPHWMMLLSLILSWLHNLTISLIQQILRTQYEYLMRPIYLQLDNF